MTLGGKGSHPHLHSDFPSPLPPLNGSPFKSCIRLLLCSSLLLSSLSPVLLMLSFLSFLSLVYHSSFLIVLKFIFSFNSLGLMVSFYTINRRKQYGFHPSSHVFNCQMKIVWIYVQMKPQSASQNGRWSVGTFLHKEALKWAESHLTQGQPHIFHLHIRSRPIL